ncbi:hypothetical protein PVAND_009177 [Polypedilum vanderplanki]|uniref:Uncharacterized protein n=1 Tax=Polypedilum vanderplanki TaxID=319348 RepID=A0A9J6CBU3_POLVA|nr:hypothetical protein PVAND_009177 [Polypedilum vanderplanki]
MSNISREENLPYISPKQKFKTVAFIRGGEQNETTAQLINAVQESLSKRNGCLIGSNSNTVNGKSPAQAMRSYYNMDSCSRSRDCLNINHMGDRRNSLD